jgi:hypothetical protein
MTPELLASLGYRARYTTEPSSNSVLDKVILRYDDRLILVLDYKGPNCIFVTELSLCSSVNLGHARNKRRNTRLEYRGIVYDNLSDGLFAFAKCYERYGQTHPVSL